MPDVYNELREQIEAIIYKNSDDIAISIARSFERLEERIDENESRLYGRLSELEDKLVAMEQNFLEELTSIRDVMNQ